ncbi:MAG: hypothetical protein K2K90_18455 [Lachnospiraceae bacterium]|nr:hypothetical protein [Lachnospiraceae bacterium]
MLKIQNFPKNIDTQVLQSFVIDDNLFPRIQEFVQKNQVGEGACFSVLDKTGKQLFLVTYLEDLIKGAKRKNLSDYFERFSNIDDLDFTLLDRFQSFLFLEVDDYSVAVAKLLLKYRPNRKIIFGDVRAKYFFEGSKVKYLSSLYGAGRHMELTEKWMRGGGGENIPFGSHTRFDWVESIGNAEKVW